MEYEKKIDFFFGEISNNQFLLSDLLAVAERVTPVYFNGQLNRLLTDLGGVMKVTSSLSNPPFKTLLNNITTNEIGKVEIQLNSEINSHEGATLNCSIWLPNGVIHVIPEWCSHSKKCADQLVESLLLPLHLLRLKNRSYLNFGKGEFRELNKDGDIEAEIAAVLKLSESTLEDDIINEYAYDIRLEEGRMPFDRRQPN